MLRHIVRRAISHRFYATRQRRRVPVPVVDIESQIAEFPVEQRKQILDQVHGDLPPFDQSEVGGNDFTANLIIEYLENAESPEDLDEGFWSTVTGLAKSATREKNPEYLNIFAALFDSAKTISDPDLRRNVLFIIGRYIYRQKRVRMDPVNEVEFLDSLASNGRIFGALKYWKSRQLKPDVAGSVYWPEVGVLYHLQAGLIRSADRMSTDMKNSFENYVPPRVIVSLIGAYSKQIQRDRDVEFAKRRLGEWVNELLSMPYAPHITEADEANEQVPIEMKLSERKPATASDLTSAISAIVVAREWSLAAQFVNSFTDLDNEDLMKALELSNASKSGTEESIMPFIDAILTQEPKRVNDSRVTAAIVLSFARSGDLEDMIEILKDLKVREIELPDQSQGHIARAVLQRPTSSQDEGLYIIEQCLSSPSAAREAFRSFNKKRKTQDSEIIARFWNKYNGDITENLASEVLRSKVVRDEKGILELGVSAYTWKYIWYLIGSRKVSVSPKNAFKRMQKVIDAGMIDVNDGIVALALQGIVAGSLGKIEGAVNALGALLVFGEKYNIQSTPLVTAVLLQTLTKVSKNELIVFTPPSKRDISEAVVSKKTQMETIPWEDVAKHATAILKIKDLEQLAKTSAEVLKV